ncbi:MAG: asparagine synthase (glutamine-hydrolyzing) [Planctomycetes bacterium RBG_13_63_9]|nr:MAG: asparagine synthase (glutamine-hydrolyzing) [Planctomycetes bacterium RBG_13_63_9]
MCGIAGFITTDSDGPHAARTLSRMLEPLRMRGPDSEGQWTGQVARRTLGLGHRRLAILDLSPLANQPMFRGDLVLVYNGEIYNYLELRRELESGGQTFVTHSDTEVLLAAYRQWGEDCLARLNGMFAFALWDAGEAKLFCARDRAGEKPFYYYATADCFVFASEIKALLRFGAPVPCAPDVEQIEEYFVKSYQPLGPKTFFRGIRELLPAHRLTVQATEENLGPEVRPYWQYPTAAERQIPISTARFREIFDDSVRLRLRSDVPIGTCLSGGVDSPSVAAAVAQLKQGETNGQFRYVGVHAYAPVPGADERPYVERVAGRLGFKVSLVEITGDGCLEELDELVYRQEVPFLGPSIYAQRCVFRRAAELGLKVMLDGQGADELFGGYDWVVPRAIAARWRESGWGEALRQARMFAGARFPMGSLLARAILYRFRRSKGEVPDDLDQALRASFLSLSLPALLRYADRNSMSFGVEARLPFLDHRLIEATAGLATRDCAADGMTKVILRRAMRDRLPEEILQRKDKTAFAVPEAQWIRAELRQAVRDAVGDPFWKELAFPSRDKMLRRALAETEGAFYHRAAWKVLCLSRWYRTFFEDTP